MREGRYKDYLKLFILLVEDKNCWYSFKDVMLFLFFFFDKIIQHFSKDRY